MNTAAENAGVSFLGILLITVLAGLPLWICATIATVFACLLYIAQARPDLLKAASNKAAAYILSFLKNKKPAPAPAHPKQIALGMDTETQAPLFALLPKLGSIGVYASTGSGKTSLVHSLIHQLIQVYDPSELQILIADLKNGLDFRIYRRLPHLALPIASTVPEAEKLLAYILEEMDRRAILFRGIPDSLLCNDLGKYHALIEKHNFQLPRLPLLFAIFDEVQNVALESKAAEGMLTKIAKEGRAYGITVLCSTQLPKADIMNGNLKAQLATLFVGWMATPRDYYGVTEIPKEFYDKMQRIPGRFIARIDGAFSIMQSVYIPEQKLESVASRASRNHQEPQWPDRKPSPASSNGLELRTGSVSEKQARFAAWLATLDRTPTAAQVMSVWNCSEKTAYKYLKASND